MFTFVWLRFAFETWVVPDAFGKLTTVLLRMSTDSNPSVSLCDPSHKRRWDRGSVRPMTSLPVLLVLLYTEFLMTLALCSGSNQMPPWFHVMDKYYLVHLSTEGTINPEKNYFCRHADSDLRPIFTPFSSFSRPSVPNVIDVATIYTSVCLFRSYGHLCNTSTRGQCRAKTWEDMIWF